MSTLGRFGPPVALMALIFFFSAQPDLNSGFGVWDLIGRKIVHASEYALLFCLWWRALGPRHAAWAAAIAIGFSITDEFHQTFVHGRHGSPLDVLIDASGVAMAFGAVTLLVSRRRAGAARTRPG